jgi:hypothetical protein
MNGRSWPGAAVLNVRAKQTMDKLRISAKGSIAAPAPKGVNPSVGWLGF